MKLRKKCCLALCVLMLLSVGVCAFAEGALADYAGCRVGVLTGSVHDALAQEKIPNCQLSYFTTFSDMVLALQNESLDAFVSDQETLRGMQQQVSDIIAVDEPLATFNTGFVTAKDENGTALRDELSEFLDALEGSGELARLQEKWMTPDAPDYAVDMSGLDGKEKTLVMATSCSGKPISYYYDGQPTGYELEIAAMFCREYGYGLDVQVLDFAGILPGIVNGKFDFAGDGIAITAERAESVNFTRPDYTGSVVLAVRSTHGAGQSVEKKSSADDGGSLPTLEELNAPNVHIATVIGSMFELYSQIAAPKAQIDYFNTSSDILLALSTGQIDAFMLDEPVARYYAATNEDIALIETPLEPTTEYGFIVGDTPFDDQLLAELNEFIAVHRQDGLIDKLVLDWSSSAEGAMDVDYPEDTGKGTVVVAVEADFPPVGYVVNSKIVGFDVDILARFCREYGYGLQVENLNFSGIIPGVVTGRYNVGATAISITEERREQVRFTDPYFSAGGLTLVNKPTPKVSFWTHLAESFERTFIREQRWKLIVDGIGTTLVISICSAVLGTVLGFGLCLLRRVKNKPLHAFTTVYIRLLQGTPLLVLLMILYYVVFSHSGASGEFVAIIAFALNFAAYVCEIILSGIKAVDKGQTEAALAIGFTKTQTFLRIVMPQAARNFLPVYKGEFISLVKMTSIVGYIAVQDLTKMSDIIRSRTYEAFFPLIATAVIYFVLAAALTSLLKAVELKLEPKRDNIRIKGVTLK